MNIQTKPVSQSEFYKHTDPLLFEGYWRMTIAIPKGIHKRVVRSQYSGLGTGKVLTLQETWLLMSVYESRRVLLRETQLGNCVQVTQIM